MTSAEEDEHDALSTNSQIQRCEMYVTYLLDKMQPSVESVHKRKQIFETLQAQLKELGLTVVTTRFFDGLHFSGAFIRKRDVWNVFTGRRSRY
jgi:hypothetical protein